MRKNHTTRRLLATAIGSLVAGPLVAVELGRAAGTMTVDGSTTTLAFAASTWREDLFNDSRIDTIVVLSDRTLGPIVPSDEVAFAQRAKVGELAFLTLHLDGAKLVNVGVGHQGLGHIELLPASWFEFKPARSASGAPVGSLTLGRRTWGGHAWACAVEFAAPAVVPTKAAGAAAASTPAAPAPTPSGVRANSDQKVLTRLLEQAMMQKDERRAIKLLELGADPNAADQYGERMLNLAVTLCLPSVVKALVDAKADLTYEPRPGATILRGAGDCPEAAAILRGAGAR